jgi:hypothetical protein
MRITRGSRLRDCLSRSHVASVTIAVLLLWALHNAFLAVWPVLSNAGEFLFTAIAILDIPYFSFTAMNGWMLLLSANNLYTSVVAFAAASIISRWVYGVGPLRTLSAYGGKLHGRRHNV